ncbi:TPA_asm: hypothetical protein GNC95_004162 [Salmonella enterica subsp. enterica serovar Typhimurium]|uniref:Uncharacterized protein n=1 Tax=Salmonella typhimurium TaxID=90371 RepID=A0A707PHE2_SALTM|nr:hypothetical protein [Salmonella enterica]MBL6310167.1 hypothetical protein [Salmonella enterica subsp. enterica serovar Typhimurium]HAC6618598.1 hypothetical protein [Salmonella enterica subsp. enterica serovar Typhimurium]HAD0013960.1 hypothetical protein [Salmonella enterica subsp. enterica serovar Typhimurium]HAE6937822.1 hypothetical protein [Salmonella enterica subsp. enterica serovar Typhimurium]HBZ5864251.1 hypothetical protein [Salmonella enterica]
MDANMKINSNDKIESTEDWNAVTNKIQFIYHSLGKKYFKQHIDIYRIVLGKVGLTASLAVLMAKHKAGIPRCVCLTSGEGKCPTPVKTVRSSMS